MPCSWSFYLVVKFYITIYVLANFISFNKITCFGFLGNAKIIDEWEDLKAGNTWARNTPSPFLFTFSMPMSKSSYIQSVRILHD